MARRMVKRPFISVIVLAHDAERHVLRTLESVLDQDFDDVQLVVCDCASHDRTAAICHRCAEREIRLDVIELEDTDRSLAFDRALGVARGRYVLVLGQNDWLAPRALEHLHALLTEHDLELAILALSVDEDSGNGELSSHRLSFDVAPTRTKDEFRDQAPLFLADGIFNALKGKVLDRDRADALGLRMQLCGNEVSYLAAYLEDIERVGVAGQAVCHVAQREMLDRFNMAAYACCERNHERYLQLISTWHRDRDEALLAAVHRLHLREIISCIEGVCSSREISAIERNARVRDMIEAPSTRASVAVLGDTSREFGFIYGSIVRKNVTACCLSARLSILARISHLPFAARTGVMLSRA